MTTLHNLGFPRIGAKREIKTALERYWAGDIDRDELERIGRAIRARHWQIQKESGLDLVPVGDFSWYDHVLDMTCALGCVPGRFGSVEGDVDLDTYFRMARGRAPTGAPAAACEMTKWFDTNYHYLVPELHRDQAFRLASSKLFDEVAEALALGHAVKPVILGPLSWLWLGKCRDGEFDKLTLLEGLVPVYGEILLRLREQGVEWVQIDEPILCLDLPQDWRDAFERAYSRLRCPGIKVLLATYFGSLDENFITVRSLPVDGLHIDAVRGPDQLIPMTDWLPAHRVLSVGIVDGRNVWRSNLDGLLAALAPLRERLGERLWIAPSCSLLHVPIDLDLEQGLDPDLKTWLAFAVQKLEELDALKTALLHGRDAAAERFDEARDALARRRRDPRVVDPAVRERCAAVEDGELERQSPYPVRAQSQRKRLNLPLFPTTTIGSFPQTGEIRAARRALKTGDLTPLDYERRIREEIAATVRKQEGYGLDVLVHGESERSDMVEYFGERLSGFAFTAHGWVQSYGSRCVKPPILFGDVSRPTPMTVDWIRYAQSLTGKPMKGMLTGPVTLLNWSFVRDDLPRREACTQLALALRAEVLDLERAGIAVIQIDEAALREGLPLRKRHWQDYLGWAVRAFRITAGGVADETQIHSHMCYSEFNDIIQAIADMDADVVTIETSRSNMELLDAFVDFEYPNEIGPGVYDIHAPNVPTAEHIMDLMTKACALIPAERLWINPDCGLKTRGWPEVDAALQNMVAAARQLRERAARGQSAGG